MGYFSIKFALNNDTPNEKTPKLKRTRALNNANLHKKKVFQFHYRYPLVGGPAPSALVRDVRCRAGRLKMVLVIMVLMWDT